MLILLYIFDDLEKYKYELAIDERMNDMKNLTKVQITTIISLILYVIWEFYVAKWAETEVGAIIRVDIFVIYPVLILLIIISIRQFRIRKK